MENLILLVRSQLVARLGTAVASWFRIVPSRSDVEGPPVFALLLEGHLPILVRPSHNSDEPLRFMVDAYDTVGRRMDTHRRLAPPRTGESFAVVVAEAGSGFQRLKEQVDGSTSDRPLQCGAGDLPEEIWLHDALYHPGTIPALPADVASGAAEREA